MKKIKALKTNNKIENKNINTNNKFYYLNQILLIIILIIIDIFSKYIIFQKNIHTREFLSIIKITISKNTGSAFGIFSSLNLYNKLIIFLSIIVLIILIILLIKNNKNENLISSISIKSKKEKRKLKNILNLTLILSISGIFGNLYDRIVFGYVRDFISIKYFSIFNIADIYLTFSFILILYIYYLDEKNKKKS